MKKNALRFSLFLVLLAGVPAAHAQDSPGRIVETIVYDMDMDGRSDTVRLYRTPEYDFPDQHGTFELFEIEFADGKTFTHRTEDTWHTIDRVLRELNAVESANVLILPENGRTLVLLLGWPYGTGSELCLFEITKEAVRELFCDPDRQLETVLPKDFDGDGLSELLLRNWVETYIELDDIKADIGTYSPYLIYNLGDTVEIDLPLTQKYNEDNYLWMGLKYDEDIEVIYPRDHSRPYLMKI